MKIASWVMSLTARIAVSGPWRGIVEKIAVRLGCLVPHCRVVHSFCKHFGRHLVGQEKKGERIARLSSGGQMLLDLDESTVLYYFHGTMVGPSEIPVERLLRRTLREGSVFFDMGATFF